MTIPLHAVARALRNGPRPQAREDAVQWRAAVALVLRERDGDAEVLLIRRAPWLGEATAWHAYHVLIAVALALVALGLMADRRRLGMVRGQG